MNEIFKEDGIFDNLPSVSILRKIHFYYQGFTKVDVMWQDFVWSAHFEQQFSKNFSNWVFKSEYISWCIFSQLQKFQ